MLSARMAPAKSCIMACRLLEFKIDGKAGNEDACGALTLFGRLSSGFNIQRYPFILGVYFPGR